MNSKLNMYAGALLGTVFVFMTVGIVGEAIFGEEAPEKEGFAIQVAEGSGGGESDKQAAPEVQSVVPLLASADAGNGEKIFKKCQACHSGEKGGPNKVGPDLWGIVGRPVAAHEGFSYSSALKDYAQKADKWTYEDLNHFLHKPKEEVPGTKMGFSGLPDVQDRADLLAYLQTLSDSPVPFPEPTASDQGGDSGSKTADASGGDKAASGDGAAADAGGGFAAMVASADPKKGEKDFKKCQSCHSIEKGGPNKVGPNLWGVVDRPVASHEGYKYDAAMEKFAEGGTKWTYDHLNAFLEKPKDLVPGTKMGFGGISKEEDRANLVAYLRTQADEPAPLPDQKASAEGGASDSKAADASGGSDQAAASGNDQAAADASGNGDQAKTENADQNASADQNAPADQNASQDGEQKTADNADQNASSDQNAASDQNASAEQTATQDGEQKTADNADQANADNASQDGEQKTADNADQGASDGASADAASGVVAMIASADAGKGEKTFRKCQACHSIDKGGPNKVGPNLWNIVDRPVASHEGYSYSAAMKKFAEGDTKWTYEHLNDFIHKPKDLVPGTKMGFSGLSKDQERADLLAYLRMQADEPAPLPGAN